MQTRKLFSARGLFGFIITLILLAPAQSALAQIKLLGRNPLDQFLPGFWSQNLNTSNLVQGVNGNHGTNKWVDPLLPDTISAKTFTGTFTGTNSFGIQAYDPVAAGFETFNFDFSDGAPADANTVSRVGVAETLTDKTLQSARFADESSNLSGVVKANGAAAATTITPVAGVNRILIQTEVSYEEPTHYLEFTDGVLTDAQ